ncbi:MAG: hypothetical protein KF850_20640 [Labilithrix sp.]|nr:hypothetical protein [Labilithrix sp.]MBX3214456.1 hypothetical protein [Labilithrix sp.]
MSDAARRAILARRSKFVAAALAGIGVACGKSAAPRPCLEVAPDTTETAPMPCLSPPYTPRDDEGDGGDAGASGDGSRNDAAAGAGHPDAAPDGHVADAGSSAVRADAGGDAARADGGALAAPRAPKTKPPFAPPRPCLLFSVLPGRTQK